MWNRMMLRAVDSSAEAQSVHLVKLPWAKIPISFCSFLHTCTHHQPSFKLATWLPSLSRAPSQPARCDILNLTAPPLRLSGESPDNRSGDAADW